MNNTIILYGAGELGKLASQFFDFYNIKYIICDDNPDKVSIDNFDKEEVYRLQDVSNSDHPLVLVCISTFSYNAIKNKINNLGFTNVLSFFQYADQIQKENNYKHPLTNGWKIKKFSENSYDIINKNLYDLYSNYAYIQFWKWHCYYSEILNEAYPINCNDRYFIPKIIEVLHDHEVFVDIGAYDGRVSKKFIKIIGDKFNEIHISEPQINCCMFLEEQIEGRTNIYLYNTCLGNSDGWKYFNHDHNYLCKIDKKSKQTSAIRKLDTLSKIKNIKPTFIKIHVEGYELEVLKGSIKTIKKYRPIITITTYHTEDGLYKIPLWLIKNCKDYNFHWRNHNYQGQGAVMYCIPKERYNV